MEICFKTANAANANPLPYVSVITTNQAAAANPLLLSYHTFQANAAASAIVTCHCSKCKQSAA